jgi:hypothetical protein
LWHVTGDTSTCSELFLAQPLRLTLCDASLNGFDSASSIQLPCQVLRSRRIEDNHVETKFTGIGLLHCQEGVSWGPRYVVSCSFNINSKPLLSSKAEGQGALFHTRISFLGLAKFKSIYKVKFTPTSVFPRVEDRLKEQYK